MDLIGIGVRYKGREDIQDCIFLLMGRDKTSSESVIQQFADSRGRSYSSVVRVIKTAIDSTWSNSPIDDLEKNYTERFVSRIIGSGEKFEFLGSDVRVQIKAKNLMNNA